MRRKYAEISDSVWSQALDYPGKPVEVATPPVKTAEEKAARLAQLDEMIARQAERLDERERRRAQAVGRKVMDVADETPPEPEPAPEPEPEPERPSTPDEWRNIVSQLDRTMALQSPDAAQVHLNGLAQAYGMSADELLNGANRFAKFAEYAPDHERRKFYYSASADEVQKILETGKIEWQEDGKKPWESKIRFAEDEIDANGSWYPGFDKERGEESREVTLVFDDRLLDEENFLVLGKDPTATEVDITESCVALVVHDPKVRDQLRQVSVYEQRDIPVLMKAGWDNLSIYPNTSLRGLRDNYHERLEQDRPLYPEIYDHVDHEAIEELQQPFFERIKEEDLIRLYRRADLSTETGRIASERAILEYFSEILDFDQAPPLHRIADNDQMNAASARDGEIYLNLPKLDRTDFVETAMIIGHEMWHIYQDEQIEALARGELSGDAAHRATLYRANDYNVIPASVDMAGYREQLLEAEAYHFSDQVEKMVAEVKKEQDLPLNQIKNRVINIFTRHKGAA